jgi:hypothetical protein
MIPNHNILNKDMKINLEINDDDTCNVTIKNVSINYKNQLINLVRNNSKNISLEDLEEILFQAKVRSQIKKKSLIESIVDQEDNSNIVEKKDTFKTNFLEQIDLSNNIITKDKYNPNITVISPKITNKNQFLFPIKSRRLPPIINCKEQQKEDIEIYINQDCHNQDDQSYGEHKKYLDDLDNLFNKKLEINDDLDSLDFLKKDKEDSISISKNENLFVNNQSSEEFACFSDFETGVDEKYSYDSFEDDSESEIDYPEKDYSLDSSEEDSYNDTYFNSFENNTDITQFNDKYSLDSFEDDSIDENIIETDLKIESISDNENITYAHPGRIVNDLETFDIVENISFETLPKEEKLEIIKELMIEDPMIENPFEEEPIIDEPIIENPIEEEPIIDEPIIENPIEEEPMIIELMVEEPIEEEPMIIELMVEEPIEEEPIVEEPIEEEPIVEEPIEEEPMLEESIEEEPMLEESIEEEPMVEESIIGNIDTNNKILDKEIKDENIYKFKPINSSMNVWYENQDNVHEYINNIKKNIQEDDEKNNCIIC